MFLAFSAAQSRVKPSLNTRRKQGIMPPSTRIPPLLQPCVHLPRDDSILLLTSTLGASVNWLIIRFLCNALSNNSGVAANSRVGNGAGNEDPNHEEGLNVVLVTWMRDYEFWRQEGRKGGGLDLEKLRREGRLAVVDGLSGLFLEQEDEARHDAIAGDTPGKTPAVQSLPYRGAPPSPARTGLVPARGPVPSTSVTAATATATDVATGIRRGANATPSITATSNAANASRNPGLFTLRSPDLAHIKSTIHSAIAHVASTNSNNPRKTLVILDNPDILLATSDAQQFTAFTLTSLFVDLHAQPSVSHVAVHLQADTPLLSQGNPAQPIEVGHRNLVVKTAHMSRRVLSVRVLDTGVARDVSGVLRMTDSGSGLGDFRIGGAESRAKGQEVLYKIGGDGSVKVFERGAGGEG
ncbi:hypothetical protein DM02DRAFT_667423 [Periconia macrospinosa]|uniref:Elongator complex protein 5 n=1 Tax=Periconia macrospinosa TaxID=97972 RepID=A0A2V1E7F2_9PLEO|nr:hypothetical protein DM02DRAFT_667423 [Periconia macrospinosa]